MRDGLRVLVEGNRIKGVVQGNPAAPDGAHVIDYGDRVLMPGLIDAHWHSIFPALPLSALMAADVGYIYLAASAEDERTLMREFTTVRDLGGPAIALKQAIDEGLVPGPRIYPSGAMITATGGHGDLRPLSDVPSVAGTLSRVEQSGGTPATIQRAIAARARCIEHGHLMDKATAELMSEESIWLSIRPFVGDDDSICLTGQSRVQQLRVLAGTDKACGQVLEAPNQACSGGGRRQAS